MEITPDMGLKCEVYQASEEWRMICEARHVANLAGIEARRAYLALIEQRRGLDARKALEAAVKVEWVKQKSAVNIGSEKTGASNESK